MAHLSEGDIKVGLSLTVGRIRIDPAKSLARLEDRCIWGQIPFT